jgi:hypothetical protein
MKIHFTKQEYRQLLELVFMADWMMTAHETSLETASPYESLRKKIYANAKEFGLQNLIVYESADHEYYETAQLEERVMHHIEAYNQHVLQESDQNPNQESLLKRLFSR